MDDEVVRGSGPSAVKSKLGYLVLGVLACTGTQVTNEEFTLVVAVKEEIGNSSFWDLKLLGIHPETAVN